MGFKKTNYEVKKLERGDYLISVRMCAHTPAGPQLAPPHPKNKHQILFYKVLMFMSKPSFTK